MVGFWHWLAQMISIHCLSLDLIINLVGGFNPSLKNISQWEGLSHILWKKQFETTNRLINCIYHEYPIQSPSNFATYSMLFSLNIPSTYQSNHHQITMLLSFIICVCNKKLKSP